MADDTPDGQADPAPPETEQWVWTGWYGGYGDGAEIGIYDQASPVPDPGGFWHANPNDPNLPNMTESLSDRGTEVA